MLTTLRNTTDVAPDGVAITRYAYLDCRVDGGGALYIISVRHGSDTIVWRWDDVTMPHDDPTTVAQGLLDWRAGMDAVQADLRDRIFGRVS